MALDPAHDSLFEQLIRQLASRQARNAFNTVEHLALAEVEFLRSIYSPGDLIRQTDESELHYAVRLHAMRRPDDTRLSDVRFREGTYEYVDRQLERTPDPQVDTNTPQRGPTPASALLEALVGEMNYGDPHSLSTALGRCVTYITANAVDYRHQDEGEGSLHYVFNVLTTEPGPGLVAVAPRFEDNMTTYMSHRVHLRDINPVEVTGPSAAVRLAARNFFLACELDDAPELTRVAEVLDEVLPPGDVLNVDDGQGLFAIWSKVRAAGYIFSRPLYWYPRAWHTRAQGFVEDRDSAIDNGCTDWQDYDDLDTQHEEDDDDDDDNDHDDIDREENEPETNLDPEEAGQPPDINVPVAIIRMTNLVDAMNAGDLENLEHCLIAGENFLLTQEPHVARAAGVMPLYWVYTSLGARLVDAGQPHTTPELYALPNESVQAYCVRQNRTMAAMSVDGSPVISGDSVDIGSIQPVSFSPTAHLAVFHVPIEDTDRTAAICLSFSLLHDTCESKRLDLSKYSALVFTSKFRNALRSCIKDSEVMRLYTTRYGKFTWHDLPVLCMCEAFRGACIDEGLCVHHAAVTDLTTLVTSELFSEEPVPRPVAVHYTDTSSTSYAVARPTTGGLSYFIDNPPTESPF